MESPGQSPLHGPVRGRNVLGEVLAVERDRITQAVGERRLGPPSERVRDQLPVRIEVADIDGLLLGGPLGEPVAPRAGRGDQEVHQIAVRDRLEAADVEDLAVRCVVRTGSEERIDRVIDEDEVTYLLSVAVDLNLASFNHQPDEPGDEALPVVFQQLPRAVDIGQSERAGADAKHVVVNEVVVLAGGLVDAVDVGRPHQMRFRNWQRVGAPVHLARTGEDDLDVRVVVAARLENRQLGAAVDLEVGVRVLHAVDVTDLPGQVEDHVLVLDQVIHGRLLADVRDVDANAAFDPVDVEQAAAVFGEQGIDDQDLRAERDERVREVAADETEAARDHDLATAIEVAVAAGGARRRSGAHGFSDCGGDAWRAVGSLNRTGDFWRLPPSTTSFSHSFITSTPVQKTRGKLKNCDLPCARW